MNKFLISGTVIELPKPYSLGENLKTVKIKNNTVIRLNSKQNKPLETIQTICIPSDLIREDIEVGDSLYLECANIPAFTLSSDQHIDMIWANVVHVTSTSTSSQVLKAV